MSVASLTLLTGVYAKTEGACYNAGSGTVMLAHDTRPSADGLVKAAAAGVAAMGSLPIACGLLTTPQLHWMVRQCNAGLKHKEKAYFEALATGFARLASGHTAPSEVGLAYSHCMGAASMLHAFMIALCMLLEAGSLCIQFDSVSTVRCLCCPWSAVQCAH